MNELPKGWQICKLDEITVDPCQKIPAEADEFTYIDIAAIDRGTKQITKPQHLTGKEAPSRARKVVQTGDTLVSMTRPNLNAVALVPESLNGQIASTGFDVLRPNGVEPRWVSFLVRTTHFVNELDALTQGALYPAVRGKDIRAYASPLAPLAEQKRIADKLDALLMQVDACRNRLDKMPGIIKRFRKTVLSAATSGKLTEGWRIINHNDLPWDDVRLADIAEIQGGVTIDAKKQSVSDEEVPYLRVANVQRGYIDLREVKNIRIPASRLPGLLLNHDDILFNEGGDLDKLGRGWIWEGQIERCSFQNHVFRARLLDIQNAPKYISWWSNSRGLDYFLRAGKQTTNLASINKTTLCNLPISLPPPPEQAEIVRRVEALFAFADRLEARYTAARAQVENLTPALLAKAFRGELVPQDPNDEPASALLARIRAARAAPEKVKKPRASKG